MDIVLNRLTFQSSGVSAISPIDKPVETSLSIGYASKSKPPVKSGHSSVLSISACFCRRLSCGYAVHLSASWQQGISSLFQWCFGTMFVADKSQGFPENDNRIQMEYSQRFQISST